MKVLNGKISGGYRFKQFKGVPSPELKVLPDPEYVIIPAGAADSKIKPLVRSGDTVKAGQIIWRDDESVSSPVMSSVSGTVESVKKAEYMNGQYSMVKIVPGTGGDWEKVPGAAADWRKLKKEDIEEVLYLSGAAALGPDGIPTSYRSSVISSDQVEHVIVHWTGAEVYNPDPSVLLGDGGIARLIEGISILSGIMTDAVIHVVLGDSLGSWFKTIDQSFKGPVKPVFHKVRQKYPQGLDAALLKSVLGIELPSGYRGINKGVVILGIQDVCQVYEAVVKGKPLVERVIAAAGEGLASPCHLKVKIGTPVSAVVKGRLAAGTEEEIRYIHNSLLNGPSVDSETPVTGSTDVLAALVERRTQPLLPFSNPGFRSDSFSNTFAAKIMPFKKDADTNFRGEQRGCLACGFCQDVCPAEILPNIIYPYAERDRLDETAVRYGIFRCMDCNLCTYVCTSKIPVSEWLRKGRAGLLKDGYVKREEFIRTYSLVGTDEENPDAAAE